ncbi:MAG: hypothetical protein KDJ26_00925 [Alphaproteobacteria bacterium]|nr:hypothetical protein [Alphaproteobacteria bacterium]MCB1550541.1 hypothetical protein [Alphaproteobacteria bacterium]MCB9984577.1 hypothetical protein [Micavibrio sp.]HRK97920.1 hypothetical protein [Alphaproteobacteria bacterium]
MTGQINPLFMICVDATQQNSKALLFACQRAISVDGRVGLFKTMELSEFQNWAIVEDTMKQELRESGEKDLWQIAGYIRETYHLIPEFYIEEGNPMEALNAICESSGLCEVIVSNGKSDLSEYLDIKRLRKTLIPVIFIPEDAHS